jgi:isoleucyl-tRNA synthetase
MSKSKGNAVDVEELLKDFGADVCRWWVSSLAYENDVKVDLDYFNVAADAYRKIRNTIRFLLGNLADFDPANDAVDSIDPRSIDGWALAEAARFEQTIRRHFEQFAFREANSAIYEFCNEALSACYLVAVKDRLYCDRADSPRRRQTQTVMHTITELLCRLLEPIVPHTADEAYRSLNGDAAMLQTTLPLNLTYECDHDWVAAISMRQAALKAIEDAKARGIENPLDAGLVIPDPEGTIERFASEFADLCGVSRARFDQAIGEVEVEDLRSEPRCERSRKRDDSVVDRDGVFLSDRDFDAMSSS